MHMSQPTSGCNNWINDLVRLREELELPSTSGARNSSFSTHSHAAGAFHDDSYGMDLDDSEVYGPTSVPNAMTKDRFPGAARTFGKGQTFLDKFNTDKFGHYRQENIYYPFASRLEWQLALWLLRSGISMSATDAFLSLEIVSFPLNFGVIRSLCLVQVKGLHLSFNNAKELRGRAELLPSGPRWKSMQVQTSHPTKSPVYLYWRDPLDCLASILNHPLFADHLEFVPRRVYTTATREHRVYTEWMTGDDAWEMQVRIHYSRLNHDL